MLVNIDFGSSQRHIVHSEESAHVGSDDGAYASTEEHQSVDHERRFVLKVEQLLCLVSCSSGRKILKDQAYRYIGDFVQRLAILNHVREDLDRVYAVVVNDGEASDGDTAMPKVVQIQLIDSLKPAI